MSEPPEPPVYFAFTGGRQIGPVSYAELDGMAASGGLLPTDLVWQSGTPDWVPSATILSFTAREAPGADSAPPPIASPPVSPSPAVPPSEAASPHAAEAPRVGAAPSGRSAERARKLLDDLRSFSFAEVVPLSRLMDPETLGTPVSWVLLLFGLAPLVVGTLVEDPLLRLRLFNFGCGALWTVFFVVAFKTERQSLRLGVAVFFATGIFGILFVSLLQQLPPLSWIYALVERDRPFLIRLLAYVGGVGLLEEVGKGLILLFLARALGGLADAADGVFYGLMSGLGFGVYEAIAYTEFVNPRQAVASSVFSGSLSVGLYGYFVASVVRIVSLPLLHAVWTAIVGYFIGLSFAARQKTNAVIALGLLIATVLHGLYDAFLSAEMGLLAVLVAALTLLLFLSYRRNADRVMAEIRRADEAT